MPKYCDICQGMKRITLPVYPSDADFVASPEPMTKEFSCPQCVPMVPYRRVRATKVVASYDPVDYGKYQMPIERSLAARFGEYLLREGLIKFTSAGSKDFGAMQNRIVVTAHLGVVARDDVQRTGALPEIAMTKAPPLPKRLTERDRKRLSMLTSDESEIVRWTPPPMKGLVDEAMDEFDEPRDAIGARFSGLEID